ncbi:MAG: hypothetical protein JW958_12850 [Candidatus Eisenbacteria bacterium]|nr:hypothetical protein [Candidatus Eisenbacteria bacterium]
MMEPERSKGMTLRRKVLFSASTVLVVFALLEGAARLFTPPPDPGLYETHREMIRILGLSEMNRLMRFDPDRFWALRENLRRERIIGRIRGAEIDFRVSTDNRGMRSAPAGRSGGRFTILAVGNSCTFGVGVGDEETWPARLEAILRERRGMDARVRNAGVPGYTSFQGLRLLQGGGLDPAPDLAIACFGFNDVDAWGPRGDRETARALAARRAARLLDRSRLVVALRGLLRRGRVSGVGENDGERRPRLTPEEFRETLLEINRVCADHDVPLLLLVWPFRDQVEGEAPERVAYQPIVDHVGAEAGIPVIDLVGPFRAAAGPLYLDHIHADPAGCEVAARAIDEAMNRARTR